MKPHRATLILVFGILSLCVFHPLGIAAWVMGNNDLRDMSMGLMDPSGRGNTSAGRVCGIIGTIIMGIALAFILVLLIIWLIATVIFVSAAAGAH